MTSPPSTDPFPTNMAPLLWLYRPPPNGALLYSTVLEVKFRSPSAFQMAPPCEGASLYSSCEQLMVAGRSLSLYTPPPSRWAVLLSTVLEDKVRLPTL